MAMRMAATVALVAVMCVLGAPRATWRGDSSAEETSSQNSSSNQTGARCYTGNTPDTNAAGHASSAVTPATPPRREDELVDEDGWPTWLLDNVLREALQGMVPKRVVDAYDKLEKVGQGSHATVYKARERATGRVVALKKVAFNASDPESVRFMAREMIFQRRVDGHPNVMKLEGVATSRRSIYLVFEFMDDDLGRIVFRSGRGRCLTEPQIKRYMQQLLSGLQHCHERGILHLDIKASNLLLDRHGVLKLGDFGLASDYGAGSRLPQPRLVASLYHRPPELLLGATSYGVGVDLWSAGCLLSEMFFADNLVRGSGEKDQLLKIFDLFGSPPDDYWQKMELSPTLKPTETYNSTTAERFRGLPPSTIGLLTTLLALDPAARGTAGQALQSSFFSTPPLPCELSALPVVYEVDSGKPRSRRRLGVINISLRPGLNISQALKDAELTDTANSGQEPIINTGNPGQESAAANASSGAHDDSSEKTVVNASSSTVTKRFRLSRSFRRQPGLESDSSARSEAGGRRQTPPTTRAAATTTTSRFRAPDHDNDDEEVDDEPPPMLRGSDEFPSSEYYVIVDLV